GGKGAPARRMTLSPGEASAPDARHCRRPGCACRVPRTLSFEPRASRDHGRIRPRSRRGSRESPRSRGRRRQAGSVRQPWWSYYSPNSSSGVTRCGVESPSRSGVCSTLMRKKSLSEGSSLTDTLVRRYTYGNFNNLPIFGPEADFLLGIPVRQRELVSLARAQVLEQKRVTKAVLESNVSAAASICRELSIQTEHLEQAIAGGAAAVALAIEDLGDRISGELGEIRWELVQLRALSEQILAVLRRPRSTEACELLDQGVRNLVNDKVEQAEERFNLALRLDNTDYQILMNLSAVELRKGNAPRAVAFVHDAL